LWNGKWREGVLLPKWAPVWSTHPLQIGPNLTGR
jgi:hypothetical protein